VNARLRYSIAAAALVLISVVAVLVAAHTDPARLGDGSSDPRHLPVGKPAGPLDGATGWVNSPPLGQSDLAGKVVVYDFWTYSCVNCVRTLPYLRSWYDRYARDGLVIVGVHSPEFDFEHVRANVEAAILRLGVTWPVALDNDKTIWDTFKNAYWPAKYVADRDGHIRYNHIGEGGYQETQDVLRNLLGVDPASPRAASPAGADDTGPSAAASDTITPETYLGTTRGTAGARPGLITYPEPGSLATGECRLVGRWGAEGEKVTAAAAGAAIVLAYRAAEVNLVMTPPKGGTVDVQVEVDGHPLAPTLRTDDTVVDDSGATLVHVDHDGLYRLVLGPKVEEHTLRLTARQPEVAAFAFTFGP
jgi:thiol-disulfide isomerase/thioredoxin